MEGCRVKAVEYWMEAKMSTGRVHGECTNALVATPYGDIFVRVDGYHAERDSYGVLIEAALDGMWLRFCSAL